MDNYFENKRIEAVNSGSVDLARASHYDPLAEQIGRVTKALAHLAGAGIDIGGDGIDQINRVAAVKAKFPKVVA